MNLSERERLQKLDDLVLNATPEDLKKIQEIDIMTQIEGESFYDLFFNSESLVNQSIKKNKKF